MASRKLYPDAPRQRSTAMARDLAVVAAVVLFVVLGVGTRALVNTVAVLGEGVESAGNSVKNGFTSAADAVGRLPVVGDRVAGGLTTAGEKTGGRAAELGQEGQDQVHKVANVAGLLVFGIPTGLLVAFYLPGRLRQAREVGAAVHVLHTTDEGDPERRRLIAMRAAFGLPYATLLRHTADPFGDLAAGRLDALVAAAFDDAGLVASPLAPGLAGG